MLRQSRINPKVSAYAQLYGHYDFNQAPMAPPGTRVISHEKPQQRARWDPHGVDGWYLGPAPDHYRCYRVHINNTKADRIVDTVEFFPAKVAMPRTASKDLATIAAQELTHAHMHTAPAGPFSIIGGAQLEALRQLATIFNAALPPSATGGSVPLSSSQPTPACAPHTPSLRRATIPPQTTPCRKPVDLLTVCPRSAPSPRVNPSRAPAPSVRLPQYPSPRVNPSRAPPPSDRLSPAPSPRVGPRRAPAPGARLSQAPSPRVRPTRANPQWGPPRTRLNIDRPLWRKPPNNTPQPNSILAYKAPISTATSAQHSAHSIQATPMANAVIHPTTGANMEYRVSC
jgi:hypothetical protein